MKLPTITLVFDRKHTATKTKTGLLQIQVMYNRRRKFISTGIKLFAGQWDDRRRVVNHALSVEYNDTINQQLRDVYDCIKRMADRGSISLDNVCLVEETATAVDILDVMAEYIDLKHNNGTRNLYMTVMNRMRAYGKIRYMQDCTIDDLYKFNDYLIDTGCSALTRKIYLAFVRSVFSFAIKKGIVKDDPFSNFVYDKVPRRMRSFLTIEEVRKIEACDVKRFMWARDLFLFQCYTGMSYADISSLAPDMVEKINGKYYIRRKRVKTGVGYKITMLPQAAEIWERRGFKLPTLSNDEYNRKLKDLAQYVGITKKLTSHVGRHTFATLALSNGVSIEVVSKMLGHTNINTTQIYAKVLAKDVDEGFETLERNLAGK